MVIDDKYAFNILVQLMDIYHEHENIIELQKWINSEGIEKVFKLVVKMETNIDMNKLLEYPYESGN